MSTLWHYAENQLLNVTANSFKLMSILSPDHLARLQAEAGNPLITPLVAPYQTINTAYANAFAAWITAKAVYSGRTTLFEDLITELSNQKIKQWDVQIQNVFDDESPEYTELLPQRRAPFQTGAYDQRILEVQALGTRLGAYAALAATQADVTAFYGTLNSARSDQQVNEETVRLRSEELDAARITAARKMYSNLGKLMDIFNADPEQIERFFDLSLIMSPPSEQNTFTDVIAGGDTVNILSSGFDETTQFRLKNLGDTPLSFFRSDSPTGSGTGVNLAAHTETLVAASDLGTGDFVNVKNLDNSNQGQWALVIVS